MKEQKTMAEAVEEAGAAMRHLCEEIVSEIKRNPWQFVAATAAVLAAMEIVVLLLYLTDNA